MKYLVSKCENNIYLDSGEVLTAGVKYIFDEQTIRIVYNDQLYIINTEDSGLINKICFQNDEYYFLDVKTIDFFSTNFSYFNKIVTISISEELVITFDGTVILRECVHGLKYSHFEKFGEMCLIYFEGKRNYVVALKKTDLLFASYFDEYNEEGDDRYFMCKLFDTLNHGKVFHIGKEFEHYLVYLDDEDMSLHSEFVGMVFLDCIIANNHKYANNLLAEDIRQQDTNSLKDFFPTFDNYYPLGDNQFVLMKKNTLSGIFKFELSDQSISNIIEMK